MAKPKNSQSLNASSTIKGTADYIAPEVIKREKYDEKSDLWAVGVLVYEILVGIPPFNDDKVEKVFTKILAREILEWTYIKTLLDQDCIEIIESLLQTDP